GADAELVQQVCDAVGPPDVGEAAGRDVDRHRQRLARVGPLPGPAQTLAQHQVGELGDLAGVLGDGDEVLRADGTVDGVVPAGQALHADHPPVGQGDLRLEVDLDL